MEATDYSNALSSYLSISSSLSKQKILYKNLSANMHKEKKNSMLTCRLVSIRQNYEYSENQYWVYSDIKILPGLSERNEKYMKKHCPGTTI